MEGGFVDNPRDPGGATNKGITQTTFNSFLRLTNRSYESVRNISHDDVFAIYKRFFWLRAKCYLFNVGCDLCIFDFAVNSGVGAIARFPIQTGIDQICDARLEYLLHLPTWRTFGEGWTRRVRECRIRAHEMAKGVPASAGNGGSS